MVIAIIGENCCGKSTLADALHVKLGGQVVTGKDYLRMAKSPPRPQASFSKSCKAPSTAKTSFTSSPKRSIWACCPRARSGSL